jgi:hypothetical protein
MSSNNKLDKILSKIFHPNTPESEAASGFLLARQLYSRSLQENKNISIVVSQPAVPANKNKIVSTTINLRVKSSNTNTYLDHARILAGNLDIHYMSIATKIIDREYTSISLSCVGEEKQIASMRGILKNYQENNLFDSNINTSTNITFSEVYSTVMEHFTFDKFKFVIILGIFIFFWNLF